ncbi:Uncharacterized protein TPAR_04190 [Tolypocladium paradoxum]|uniref:LDB19 N-terminal domain-containing protein n=1 Tax=Tolypocladium paradoxum TaxID=94208 RepID=A0A2S4KZJ3_9HYPO|nr:Uncharacterized protein TPAR_04190 [Tolypocladium paradoxum]
MPHRVANFLRSSSGSISHITKKATGSSSSSSSGGGSGSGSGSSSRNHSASTSPYASDSDDHPHAHAQAVKMPGHRRLSLPFGRSNGTVRLDWRVESPPLVFYGTPEESTGALLSGQMFLDVAGGAVDVDSFVATLTLRVTHKRPYQGHCADCQTQDTELRSWRLLAHPATLFAGRHPFPFSALLEGHLPASMDSPVLSMAYEFRAEAMVVRNAGPAAASLLKLHVDLPLVVKRSLPEPLYPHNSVRVFPPTNVKACAYYGSVIHPTGNNTLTLKLDGLVTPNPRARTLDLWRLKKVTWRLEETIKAIAPACARHALSAMTVMTEEGVAARKGAYRSETRVIGEHVMEDGWKSDYSGNDGTVDMEFDYTALNPPARPMASSSAAKYACDTKTQDGTEVTHTLLLELVVSKERAPEGKPQLATQTGTGRLLRMRFAVALTEFSGLGVSWDNEAPPVYQDVPPSPPGYPCDAGQREPPIDYSELDALEAQRATPPARLSDAELSE